MSGLRLIMAQSADGIVALGPDDDMSWTGPTDKAVFRLLTAVGPRVLGAGTKTHAMLAGSALLGRRLLRITRGARVPGEEHTLAGFARMHPGAWLLGGPHLAWAAIKADLVSEVHLVTCFKVKLGDRPPSSGDHHVATAVVFGGGRPQDCGFRKAIGTRVSDVVVEAFVREDS